VGRDRPSLGTIGQAASGSTPDADDPSAPDVPRRTRPGGDVAGSIAVIGTGYVGLTTGACLAHLGHDVVCADVDRSKVERLERGEIPILEDGLEELVRDSVRAGRLRFVLGAENAVADREFIFLCVPTPQGADGSADLSYIEAAAKEISPHLLSEAVVINKSTVPVGSTLVVERALQRADVSVVSNPEFLREGSAVHDFLHPDRVVIGSTDQAAAIRVASLYLGLAAPLMVTDPASAETIKYASNAFLAAKISFVNAIAAVCEAVGADVNDVVLGMGYDKRIGQEFLRPGPGWGGSCFPKDSHALVRIAEDAGYEFGLLKGVIEVNEQQFDRVVTKVREAAGGSLEGVRVAAWGLTFKARTDDLRDSPAIEIIHRLQAAGAEVRAYDPAISADVAGIEVAADPYAACEGAEVLAVLTEWDEFRWLDLDKVGDAMAGRRVVDARNLLDRNRLRQSGFEYQGIGRS
jgi:UDPglucose 6-dehydrogenase